jgi:hypothetical protein
MIIKVSFGFARLSDMELDNFAQRVVDSMTGNATYPAPPITIANLLTAKNDFTNKIAAAQAGGPTDTAAKNNSRQTLMGMLRQLAAYVQMSCNNDTALLLSSGFQAQSTNRASARASHRSRTRACTKAESNPATVIGCRAFSPAIRNTSLSTD